MLDLCSVSTLTFPPFSHAVKVPGLIFLSGQTPVDENGKLVEGDVGVHTVSLLLLKLRIINYNNSDRPIASRL